MIFGPGLQRLLGFDESSITRFNASLGYSGNEFLGPILLQQDIQNRSTVVISDGKIRADDDFDEDEEGPSKQLVKVIYASNRPPDVHGSLTALYVYCNLVRERTVGDSVVSLLRVVPSCGVQGEIVDIAFHPVQYLPMNQNFFDTVEINIRDDVGRPVPFQSGRVIITLHLRPQ